MNQRLLPYTPERDVYRLLGIPATASHEEVTAACRRLARTFHPDHNRSTRANQEMQVVNAVRSVLSDPATRAIYDRERSRFHANLGRVAPRPMPAAQSSAPTWRPAPPTWRPAPAVAASGPPAPAVRYLRAAYVGLRAALIGLAPPRCRGCRVVIDREDAYCAACGTPLLTGG